MSIDIGLNDTGGMNSMDVKRLRRENEEAPTDVR